MLLQRRLVQLFLLEVVEVVLDNISLSSKNNVSKWKRLKKYRHAQVFEKDGHNYIRRAHARRK